jgi:hypothetical protein
MTEKIEHSGALLAIIIYNDFNLPGIHFFTPDEFSQQLAYMSHSKGKLIDPHFHNLLERTISYTQEVLFIKKGKIRVDFYDNQKYLVKSKVLCQGDTIMLAGGGHGFEVLEDIEMVEVKQGPFSGELDKTRFTPLQKNVNNA